MRRVTVTIAMLGGLLVATVATPAAAAPPMKESGTAYSLSSQSSECTTEGGRTVCTDIYLDAYANTAGTGQVCVSIETYALTDRRQIPISSESGCSEVDPSALNVTKSLDATLATTTVSLQTYTCSRRRECQVSGSRAVTVSASDTATGPVSTSTGRGSFSDDECTYRYAYDSTSAEVAGTITLDGTTYEEQGYADITDYRVTTRCS